MSMRGLAVLVLLLLLLSWTTEAGVVGLSKYMRAMHRSAWVKDVRHIGTLQVDHICIDMNQVLHGCFRTTRSQDHIMAKIFTKLDHIFAIARPRKSLVLAFDGPAPYAKVQTQRDRRMSHPESCIITPGTTFMNAVESMMLCYCMQRHIKLKLGDVAVFISDGTCPGEGELKIIDWVRQHMPLGDSSRADQPASKDTTLICGSDSDILVQSLCIGDVAPNTVVLQMSSEGIDAICNVTMLRAGIVQSTGLRWMERQGLSNSESKSIPPGGNTPPGAATDTATASMNALALQSSLQLDLVVLFALQGNDYLPKLRSISNSRALQAYGLAMNALPVSQRYLVDLQSGSFNFPALYMLFRTIDASNRRLPVALPVVLPDPIVALNMAVLRMYAVERNKSVSARAASDLVKSSLNWQEAVVNASAVSILRNEGTGEKEYFMSHDDEPHCGVSTVVFHADEARNSVSLQFWSEPNLRLWRASVSLHGKLYVSLKLHATKRSARRSLAELVLREVDAGAFTAYEDMREEACEALQRLRCLAAADPDPVGCASRVGGGEQPHWATNYVVEAGWEQVKVTADLLHDVDDECDESDDREGGNKDGGAYCSSGEEEPTAEVSSEEYLQYVRSCDVQHYLTGILWIAHMYGRGECPDLGYTYSDRPPITALAVLRYLERNAAQHAAVNRIKVSEGGAKGVYGEHGNTTPVLETIASAQDHLAGCVHVPKSDSRSLTADATGLCVLPEEGVKFLPLELR
jgi:hypothetical protein